METDMQLKSNSRQIADFLGIDTNTLGVISRFCPDFPQVYRAKPKSPGVYDFDAVKKWAANNDVRAKFCEALKEREKFYSRKRRSVAAEEDKTYASNMLMMRSFIVGKYAPVYED